MFLNCLLAVFLLFNFILCDERATRVKRIVGGIPADAPPVDDPVVYTRFGGKAAKVIGIRDFPNYVFRGIRYAYPPVGKDRFLRPREKNLEGEINATRFSQPCIQPRPGTNKVIGSEDCLALNVFTPELPTGLEGLPVVIWIHGGGFRYGSASQYGVRHLIGKRLVVVTIQYRLGSLGFLSSGDKHLPGNVALWDMVLAVQWVRNYIGFFGGNPYRIVVMGHGTGASSALLVVLSKIAKGKISGAVAMSGTPISNWAVDQSPQNTATNIAHENGCTTSSTVTMVKCLQNLPPDIIIRGDSDIEFQRLQSRGFMSRLSGGLGAAPVSEGYNDGRSLPGLVEDEPINDLNEEKNPKIPLLTGITRDETKRAVQGHLRKDIEYKLSTIPNFLDNVLVKQLRGTLFTNKLVNINSNLTTNSILPLNFENYLDYKSQNLHEALNKIAEVTGDALFNLPAFLTVNRWSKNGAPTYLYSFEHLGNRQKGDVFLRGSPIIGNETIKEDFNNTIGHGDDLAYIFDVYDIEGNSLETDNNLNEDDKKVRDIFTQMISDFAHYGKIRIDGRDVEPFSTEKNNFVQIKAKPSLSSNFRVCQMALWSNLVQKLKSDMCSFLDALNIKVLTDIHVPLPPLLNNNTVIDLLPKPNLIDVSQGNSLPEAKIPGGKSPLRNKDSVNANRNKSKPTSILGGLIDFNNTIGHGDDLAYIFDVYDIEGNSLETDNNLNEDDKKVRDIFTQMISDFAHYGKIRIDGRDVEPFSTEKNNFVQIKAKPSLSSNFRVCQMALWSNLVQKLKSDMCSFLDALNIKVLTDIHVPLPPLLNNNTVIDLLPKPNLIDVSQGNSLPDAKVPGGKSPLRNKDSVNANRNKSKPTSILGGLIG